MARAGRNNCIPATDSEFCTCQLTFVVQDVECNVSSCHLPKKFIIRGRCVSLTQPSMLLYAHV